MGKISDYPKVQTLSEADTFLLESSSGTRGILAKDLAKDIWDLLDPYINPVTRRNIWRGKNLGSVFTDEQKAAIRDGSFRGMFIGDYWETTPPTNTSFGGTTYNRWRIVDIDYFIGSSEGPYGENTVFEHHLTIMPDFHMHIGQMVQDSGPTVADGYAGSLWKTMYEPEINDVEYWGPFDKTMGYIINPIEVITTKKASDSSYEIGSKEDYSNLQLPTEVQITGNNAFSDDAVLVGSPLDGYFSQFAAFRLNSSIIRSLDRGPYWLRDLANNYRNGERSFEIVDQYGKIGGTLKTASNYFRPYFSIKG